MDKLVYALNLIVDFIDINDRINERAITDYLFFTGFDDYEIRQVLALLDMNKSAVPESFRIFSRTEKQLFSPEAIYYIDKLLVCGVLDFIAVEEVIEKAESQGFYKITVDQVKELTLLTLFEKKSDIYNPAEATEDYIQ